MQIKLKNETEIVPQNNGPKSEDYYGGGGGCPFVMSGFYIFKNLSQFFSQKEKSKNGTY